MQKLSRFYLPILFLVFMAMNLRINLHPEEVRKDAFYYHCVAEALAGNSSTVINTNPSYHGRDIGDIILPGYPFVASLVYRLFGVNPNYIFLFQFLLTGIALFLIHRMLRALTSDFWAFLGCLWLITYRPFLRTISSFYLENATLWMLVFALYAFFRLYQTRRIHFFYLYSLAFAVLITFNNRFIFHYAVVTVAVFIYFLRKGEPTFRHQLFSGLLVLLVLLPWHIRQHHTYGRWVVFSPFATSYSQGEGDPLLTKAYKPFDEVYESLYNKLNSNRERKEFEQLFTPEYYDALKEHHHPNGAGKYLSRLTGFFNLYRTSYAFGFGDDYRVSGPNLSKTQLFLGWAFNLAILLLFMGYLFFRRYYGSQPVLVSVVPWGLVVFLLPGFYQSTDLINIGLLFAACIPGIYFAWKQKNTFLLFCILLVGAHMVLHSYTHFITRYRLTVLPLLFLLAMFGLSELNKTFAAKRDSHAV